MSTPNRLLIALALLGSWCFAQDPGARTRDTRDPADPKTRLERGYERAAHDALTRYFSDNTFLVRAHVELEDEEEYADAELPASAPSIQNLPGLPYQPLQMPGAPSPATAVQLRNVDLEVLVDTGYTQKDRDFIQYLVTLAGNLDTARGDMIRISRAYFPRDDRSLRKQQSWTDDKPSTISTDSVKTDTLSIMDTPLSKLLGERLLSQLPLILVCVTVLVCVWLLRKPAFAALPNSLKGRFRPRGRRATLEDATPPPVAARPPQPPGSGSGQGSPTKDAESVSGRSFLVNSFVGEPRTSGQILRNWMERDSEKGAKAASILLNSLNPKLLDLVREQLGAENSRKIETLMNSKEDASEADLKTVSKGFRKEFQAATQTKRDGREDDLFGFLDQLNEGQVMHILKDEPLGVSGFVLAQISPAKSGAILQKLDAANRSRFMYAIGNITQIPREVYKEMADRLSLKALEVSNMKFVASDGVESLVNLIENLPIAKQFEYIHGLSEVDLNLAKKLRGRTVTFPELATLPDKFLARGLQTADGDTLALALQAAEASHQARFLQLLPERMRMMVQSSMESKRHAPPAEIESAQNRLLRIFRDEIRRTGRPS
ncbi:MAG: FliG C-terminal domain-containing protein [Fibrobacterota bacterium]